MAALTAWEILDLEPDATLPEIRRAYRRLAIAVHPDHNPGDLFAAARFREVRAAYETLLREEDERARQPLAGGPVTIACTLRGEHLVGTLSVRAHRVGRHRWVPLTLWATRTCERCHGEGIVHVPRAIPIFTTPWECTRCHGVGLVAIERRVRVRLSTTRPGTAVRLAGIGVRRYDGVVGDAYVHLA